MEAFTGIRSLLTLFIVLAFFQAFVPCAAKPGDSVIFSIFPSQGSLKGGTLLTVLGANFQRRNISGV